MSNTNQEDGWTTGARFASAAILPIFITFALGYFSPVTIRSGWLASALLATFLGLTAAVCFDPKGRMGYPLCFLAGLSPLAPLSVLIFLWGGFAGGIYFLVLVIPVAIPLMSLGSLTGWWLTQSLRKFRDPIAA